MIQVADTQKRVEIFPPGFTIVAAALKKPMKSFVGSRHANCFASIEMRGRCAPVIKQNNDFRSEDIEEIASQIERYLKNHPNAADSLDGILHWWLTRQRYEESAQHVRQALERLLRRGTITARVMIGGGTLYARRPKPTQG